MKPTIKSSIPESKIPPRCGFQVQSTTTDSTGGLKSFKFVMSKMCGYLQRLRRRYQAMVPHEGEWGDANRVKRELGFWRALASLISCGGLTDWWSTTEEVNLTVSRLRGAGGSQRYSKVWRHEMEGAQNVGAIKSLYLWGPSVPLFQSGSLPFSILESGFLPFPYFQTWVPSNSLGISIQTLDHTL